MEHKTLNVVDINIDEEKGSIKAPWGDLTVTYKEGDISLKWLAHARDQLIYFRNNGNTTEFLERDIRGYEIVLKSGSEELAEKFIDTKRALREKRLHYGDNLKVLESIRNTEPKFAAMLKDVKF